MSKLALLVFIITLVFHISSSAQQFKKFTEEPEAYLEEMKKLFARDATNYDKGKDLLDELEEAWLTGGFSAEKQKNIYEISDLLLKRKARNFPHFYNYVRTLLLIYQNGMDSINYLQWEDGLRYLTTHKKIKLRDIDAFLNSTYHLVDENVIYYSKSVKWYSNNSDYNIVLDSDTIKIVFNNLTLTGKLRKDSILIEETSGVYYPLTKKWKGNSAKVYWEKTGVSKDVVWAEIGQYSIPMKKASYTLNNVTFYNKNYFDYSLKGTLTDKIVEVRSQKNLSYPRFDSQQKNFIINDVFKDINYKGGFSMRGNKFVGSGSSGKDASLLLYRDIKLIIEGDTIIEKQLFMRTFSQYYAFKESEINSSNCKVSMYVDTDSIYHPGLKFHYSNKHREINLIRDKNPNNMSRSPYYDTYHKIEMDFELLKWKMDELKVDFTMLRGSSINIANFESKDYFSASRYFEVQGIEHLHPYISIRRFSRYSNSIVLYDEDLAQYMKYPLTPIRRMLIDFTYRGIVDYDSESGYFTVKQKLFDYLDAIAGRKDYDLIKFESRTLSSMNNAILNLQNMDIAIQGVPEINVSDSQNVVFYPKNQEILLKKNRDFDFSGKVDAGFFTFYGDNFQFKYDSFKVALNNVDSLKIKVKAGTDDWGRKILANVENVIEDVTGDVIIDDPTNKSGVRSYPQYPIFNSEQESFVYYDASNIQKGKYTRDKFYFIVDAYKIDSLNNFSTDGMGYDGKLISHNIFPDIKQRLVLQPDNSLGFHHNTPKDGFPIYNGKGQYYSDIHLSNQGLRGNGHFNYLTSTAVSEDFIFYPDSTNTNTTKFDIRKQISAVQYPKVNAGEIYLHWMPYNDELYTNTIEQPFTMYENKAKHSGKHLYTPKKLIGSGVMTFNDGELTSDLINYQADKFNADTANFKLNSINPDMLALSTENVNSKVDYIEMKSSFKSNTDSTQVKLPENLYHAYVEQFIWLMNEKNIQLSTPNTIEILEQGKSRTVSREDAGLESKGSLYVSVHSGQDSLNWKSAEANFDLTTNTIFAHDVKFIDVADVTVFPYEGEVVIEPQAYMKTLRNAELLANRETKYHRFHKTVVNITTRNKYHAEGKYNYEDDMGRFQPIHFNVITVDSIGNTFAKGNIQGIDEFTLSQAFGFRGIVLLKAPEPLLSFSGHTKINHECNSIKESWLSFNSEIDPNNIFIPLDEQPKDINDLFLVSGAMLATDSIHVFPTFISPRKRYSNIPVMSADGFLSYNKNKKLYIIGSKERIADPDTTGNILTLQKNNCNMYGEGKIDLTANLGRIEINTAGNGLYKIEEDKFDLDLLMTVDFYLPEACIKFISDTLATMTALKPISLKNKTYVKSIKELLPYDEADEMLKQQNIFGTVTKVPKKLSTTFVFSELGMAWNKKRTSWESTGDIGIANILGIQINRKIKGNVSITRKRSGDSFDLYLKISDTHWYYFNYKRGLMQAYSSEAGFNNIIIDIKGNDRKLKAERGEASYVFFLSNKKKRNKFLKEIGQSAIDDGNTNDDDEDIDYEQYEDFD